MIWSGDMEVLAGVVKTLFCPECSNQILEQKVELIKKKKIAVSCFLVSFACGDSEFSRTLLNWGKNGFDVNCHIVDAMRLCCLKSWNCTFYLANDKKDSEKLTRQCKMALKHVAKQPI